MATTKQQKLAEAAARNPMFAKPTPAKPAVITANPPAKAPAPKGKK
jgi:hypothetical protein